MNRSRRPRTRTNAVDPLRPTTARVTTTVTLAVPGDPEDLRHDTLWVVATKSGRERPWTLVAATLGETPARVVLEPYRANGALCALVPSRDSGGTFAVRTNASAGSVDREWHRVRYAPQAPRPIEVWDEGKRVA